MTRASANQTKYSHLDGAGRDFDGKAFEFCTDQNEIDAFPFSGSAAGVPIDRSIRRFEFSTSSVCITA